MEQERKRGCLWHYTDDATVVQLPHRNLMDSAAAERLILRVTAGRDYKFRVRAVNDFGESEPLETSRPVKALPQTSKLSPSASSLSCC